MPATALSSRASVSNPPAAASGFLAAPALAASATDFKAARMFFSVSSRPCSAASVASPEALRSCSPCRAVAFWNMSINAAASKRGLAIVDLLDAVGGLRDALTRRALRQAVCAMSGEIGPRS